MGDVVHAENLLGWVKALDSAQRRREAWRWPPPFDSVAARPVQVRETGTTRECCSPPRSDMALLAGTVLHLGAQRVPGRPRRDQPSACSGPRPVATCRDSIPPPANGTLVDPQQHSC